MKQNSKVFITDESNFVLPVKSPKANSKTAKEKAIAKLMLKEDATILEREKVIEYVLKNGLEYTFIFRRISDGKIAFNGYYTEDFKKEVKETFSKQTQSSCEVMKTKGFQDTKNSNEFLREKIKELTLTLSQMKMQKFNLAVQYSFLQKENKVMKNKIFQDTENHKRFSRELKEQIENIIDEVLPCSTFDYKKGVLCSNPDCINCNFNKEIKNTLKARFLK